MGQQPVKKKKKSVRFPQVLFYLWASFESLLYIFPYLGAFDFLFFGPNIFI